MAQTRIAELTIAPSIIGSDFIIVDNTEVTRRTTLNSLASFLSTIPSLSSQSYNATVSLIQANSGTWSQGSSAVNSAVTSIVTSNSANWNNTYTVVSSNSASWALGSLTVNSVVISNSANWNNTYTAVNANSGTWSQGNSAVNTAVISNSAAWSSVITKSTAGVGSSLIFGSKTNETIYLNSSSTSPLSSIFLQLPNYNNSFVGQVKIFISSKDITTISISVQSGGTSTIAGNILSFTNAFEPKTYQCIDITGTAVTWLRIS